MERYSIPINKYIEKERILNLDRHSKISALKELSAVSTKMVRCVDQFYNDLLERENIMSTGMGFGICFPHVKTAYIPEFFISIGFSQTGIDWQSFDNQQVNLIFLIGGPDGQQKKYLQILSTLSLIVKNPDTRSMLFRQTSSEGLLNYFNRI